MKDKDFVLKNHDLLGYLSARQCWLRILRERESMLKNWWVFKGNGLSSIYMNSAANVMFRFMTLQLYTLCRSMSGQLF